MAVTVAQLATAIRLAVSAADLSDEETEILTRQHAVALNQVTRYAPDAPEVVRDEAVVRIVGYLFYSSPAGGRQLYANALASSGAAGLLDQYRSAEFITLGDGTATAASGAMPSGGGAPADQEAIDAAIAAHNALVAAHRDLSLTLDQVKTPLEAAAGNARLRGSAVRDLAAEIDAELGSNRWRDPNQPGQAGQTASQVDARIHAQTGQTEDAGPFAVNRIPPLPYVRWVGSAPEALATGQVIILNERHYIGRSFASRGIKITVAQSGDDTGYAAAQGDDAAYGGVDSPNDEWLVQFTYDSDDQAIVARLISHADPGATIRFVHGSLGTYTLTKQVGQGAGTTRNAFVDSDVKYQYALTAQTDPFRLGGVSGEQDFTVDPAGMISYWEPFTPTAAPSGGDGLDQAAVDARIEALRPVAYSAEEKAKVALYPDGGDTGNAGKVLKFDNSGNPITATDDGLNQTEVDARIVDHLSDDTPAAIAAGDGAAGTGAMAARDDHSHPYTAPPSGGPGMATPLSDTAPEPVGTAAAGDDAAAARGDHAHPYGGTVPSDNLPEKAQVYLRALQEGGPRPYPLTDIQIGGVIKDSAYSVSDFNGITQWGNSVTHSDATAVSPSAYAALRMSRTEFSTRPTALPTNVVMRVSADLDALVPVLTSLPAADTAGHWAFSVTWGPQPADDQTATLEIVESATSDILPPDGSLEPTKLKGEPGDGLIEAVGDRFRSTPPSQFQVVYSGSSGVSPTSLSGNSALVTFEFDQGVNLGTVGDGELISDDHLRIVTGPEALSWSPTEVIKTINVRGSLSFQQIGFEEVYNGSNHLGAAIINPPLYIGATRVGNFYRRIAKDDDDELDGNVRYDFASGHSNIAAASISDQVHIFKLSTGGSVLPTGAVGHNYVREAEVPAAAGFRNDDVLDVREGSERGHYAKKSEFETGAADTGWAGKSIDAAPRGNLQPVDVVGGERRNLPPLSLCGAPVHRPQRDGANRRRRRVAQRSRAVVCRPVRPYAGQRHGAVGH